MQAIRITRTLDSETLHLPQLRSLVGQQVEIIVLSENASTTQPMNDDGHTGVLVGSVLRYDDPFEAATTDNEWEANQ